MTLIARLIPALAAGLLAALPALSQDLGAQDLGPPMDTASFDARTQGRTITYSVDGLPYGIEQYLPGQRVRWAFSEGECKEGDWFQADQFICFDYHDESGLQCWTFHEQDGELVARFRGDDANAPLVGLIETDEPLACQGPEIGV
jgi:hypothetical protein